MEIKKINIAGCDLVEVCIIKDGKLVCFIGNNKKDIEEMMGL